LLTRLAELGGEEGVNLVIHRLDSGNARQFAAIAACRAGADVWPALEPAVLAHLTPSAPRNDLQDHEKPLLLALVRHGLKPKASELIESRDLFNKQNVRARLARLEPGFGREHCRDGL
jgi:hypothetical protein